MKDFGGLRAIDHCTQDVRPGTITGLIGPNGAGKSTLMTVIFGQLHPWWGRIEFDGRVRAALQSRSAMVIALVLVFAGLWALAVARDVSAERLLSLTVWGVMLGSIIALGSIGLTLVYGVLRLTNFSHGALVTLGAYLGFAFMQALPEDAPLRPFSFGWEFLAALALDLPLGMRVQADQLFILGLGFMMVALVYCLLEFPRMGKAMRATANNPELAQVRGINTEKAIAWTWVMSGGLAAAGGAIYGLASQLRPEMGFRLLLPMFAAVIMGTVGKPRGALVGALIIGVAQQVSSAFLNPAYGPAVAFVLMVLTLLIRPQGLLGARE